MALPIVLLKTLIMTLMYLRLLISLVTLKTLNILRALKALNPLFPPLEVINSTKEIDTKIASNTFILSLKQSIVPKEMFLRTSSVVKMNVNAVFNFSIVFIPSSLFIVPSSPIIIVFVHTHSKINESNFTSIVNLQTIDRIPFMYP